MKVGRPSKPRVCWTTRHRPRRSGRRPPARSWCGLPRASLTTSDMRGSGIILTPDVRIPMSDGAGEWVALSRRVKTKLTRPAQGPRPSFPTWEKKKSPGGGPAPERMSASPATGRRFAVELLAHAGERFTEAARGLVLRPSRLPGPARP